MNIIKFLSLIVLCSVNLQAFDDSSNHEKDRTDECTQNCSKQYFAKLIKADEYSHDRNKYRELSKEYMKCLISCKQKYVKDESQENVRKLSEK